MKHSKLMARYSAEEYEALAEVRFLLEGLPSYEAIICFCSRSITRDKEELLKGMKGKSDPHICVKFSIYTQPAYICLRMRKFSSKECMIIHLRT